ncbi:MAG: hypothetical protein J5625_04210 [Lachnospiraceae bacterium]|nr:hypothetical protein [Lachnospiraceae bacterium]
MSKKAKTFIFIVAMIVVIILSWIGIRALDKRDEYDSSLCTICHQNKRIANATYCYSCYQKAVQRVEEKEKQKENATVDPKKPASSSDTATGSSGKTTSSSSSGKTTSSGSSGKTTTSSSSKKEYNSLNFDPEDYDDPDEYADDAWDEDFDSYDEAYEYWEDY